MPKIPYIDGMFGFIGPNNKCRFDYKQTPPIVYMDNFNIGFKNVYNGVNWVFATSATTEKENEDIVYSNNPSVDYLKEFNDIDLKLNSYRNEKPLGESYILSYYNNELKATEYFKSLVSYEDTYDISISHYEEEHIVEAYLKHYTKHKKIYNCEVHNYYMPFCGVKVNALPTTSYMMVDSQEYDVKSNTNELKLIEY